MKIKVDIQLEIPSLPNFIRSKDHHTVVAVSSLTKKELQQVGEEWTKALVEKSKRNK